MTTKGKGTIYVNGKAFKIDVTREDKQIIEIDFPREFYKTSHPVFQKIENEFDNWVKWQQSDTKQQYFTRFEELEGNTYLSRKEAIKEGISAINEFMTENNYFFFVMSDQNLNKIDLAGVFQP